MDAIEFGVSAVAVWAALVDESAVMVPYLDLVSATGLDLAIVAESLDALSEAGLVSLAAWESGQVATLSPLAAVRLGLKVQTRRGGWEWVSVESRERQPRPRPGDGFPFDSLADPQSAEPWEEAEAAELAESFAEAEVRARAEAAAGGKRRRRTDRELETVRDSLPYPAVTLAGVQPWPPPKHRYFCSPIGEWVTLRRCPVCRGRKLRAAFYCLICDRWGLDWLLATERRKAIKAIAKEKATAGAIGGR